LSSIPQISTHSSQTRTIARRVAPLDLLSIATDVRVPFTFGVSTHPWKASTRAMSNGSVRHAWPARFVFAKIFAPAVSPRVQNPPPKPPSSLLSCLIHQIQTSNPVEFQLPDDIKFFFKDGAFVHNAGNPKHAHMCPQQSPLATRATMSTPLPSRHCDPSKIRVFLFTVCSSSYSRLGQTEDRDPHRLRDRNGDPVLCFRCGNSALPTNLSAPPSKRPRRAASKAASPENWKNILSCDYCNLHWHLDCLDPPLSSLPPVHKKWMCPNHVERVLVSESACFHELID